MRAWLLSVAVLGAVSCASSLGAPCSEQAPCPQGLVCRVPPLPDEGLENPGGICDYPARREGEPCSQAAECEEALTCSNHFTDNTRYGQCVPRRGAGEACFQDRDCASGQCQGESGTALEGSCE